MLILNLQLRPDMQTLQKRLEQEGARLRQSMFPLEIKVEETASAVFYEYALADDDGSPYRCEMQRTAFYQKIIKSLQTYFFQEKAEEEIGLFLAFEYGYFPEEERARIVSAARKILQEERSLYFRRVVGKRLAEYFRGSNFLNIDGFLRFRMKEYDDFLAQVAEMAVDEHVAMNEYQEFADVLRYFAAVNTPHNEIMHVVWQPEGYMLLGEDNQALLWPGGAEKSRFLQEDALFSALINFSPRRIIYHQQNVKTEDENVKLMAHIFQERLTFCQGCALCRFARHIDSDRG